MKHLLNICNINGAEVEPVDVITFGSPCQDLSVAGKRAGIQDGERSNLFFEAVRIIKEMRDATNNEYPKYAVWENVPGAFSSNKGRDFHAVLEAFCSVCDDTVSIPKPYDAKRANQLVWSGAGEIVGDNYSVAWRTLDAQYWGVPQRRKRIYLVADFRGQRAGEILFKPDSVRGDTTQGNETRESATADAVGSVDGSVRAVGIDGYNFALTGDKAATVGVNCGISTGRNGVIESVDGSVGVIDVIGLDCYNQSITGYVSKSLNSAATDSDHVPCIITSTTLKERTNCEGGKNNQQSVVFSFDSLSSNSMKSSNPIINHVCYDARGNGDGETACTITGDHQNRITDYTAVAVQETLCFNEAQITSPTNGNNPQWNEPCHTLSATDNRAPTVILKKPPRKYIIRRLTPTECARLQGFPDWWSTLAPYNPADAEFWEDVRKTHAEINGKKYKPAKNLKKWYDSLHTDSAEYKMWGNGIALPNARYVLQWIAEHGAKTLGSLFDGSGGFPLAGLLNGIKPVWASEIEPYPIAVTKSRFEEVQND